MNAPTLAIPAAFASLWGIRAALARHAESVCLRRLPPGPDGIIAGAEPFSLAPQGGSPANRGALLLHGFGDTPQTLRALGGQLAAEGWTVRAPLLPGHGRTLPEFAASRSEDWIEHARAELATFREQCETVVLCGVSMGGALATILAARPSDVAALVLIAPYLSVPNVVRRIARVERPLGLLTVYLRSRGERSIHDPVAREQAIGYGYVTPRLVAELQIVVDRARDASPHVAAPTLLVQSRHDNRISTVDAERAFAMLGAPEKQLELTDDGGHVLTVDYGRERVYALTAGWMRRHAERPVAAPTLMPSTDGEH